MFVATVEITDVQSEQRITGQTRDLNLFGCFVELATPFPEGAKLRIRITWGGATVAALGQVAYARPGSGIGIRFVEIEPSCLPILDKWVGRLRT